MKKLLIFICFISTLSSVTYGQSKYKNLSDDERKALEKQWKAKLKSTDPLVFRDTYKKYQTLSRAGAKMRGQMKGVANELDAKEQVAMNLRQQIDSIRDERSGKSMATEENEKSTTGGGDYDKGLIFKVQVGALKEIKSDFKEGDKKYTAEQDADGTLKYTLGYFRVYEDADNFKRVLRSLGLKEAKVEAYQDGKRIELKDALYTLREDTEAPASGYQPVEDDW